MIKKSKTAQNTTSLAPVVFIFCFTLIYIFTGYISLDEDSRHVPIMTGYVTIFLLLFEALKRYLPKNKKEQLEGEVKANEETINVSILREFIGLLYVASLALMIYFFGFFIAVPTYLFFAITFLGNQPKKMAIAATLIASIIIYLVFQLLLEIRMYEGLLFS